MKKSLKLFLFGLLVCLSVPLFAQPIDSVLKLITTIISPPSIKGMDISVAFTQVTTWISAIMVVVFVYGAQLVPVLGDTLKKIPSGYIRALVIGGGLLWVIVVNGGLYGSQAVIAFVISNVVWEVYKLIKDFQKPVEPAIPLVTEGESTEEVQG
jgi:hypothetical protein